MPTLDELSDSVYHNLLDVNLSFDRETLEQAIQPKVTLEEEFNRLENSRTCYENARINEIIGTDRGRYVAKAIVDTELHDNLPVRFTEHTLAITCRDIGVIHPQSLSGEIIPIHYDAERDNPVFDDGNASIIITNPETNQKQITDSAFWFEWTSRNAPVADN